MQQCNLQGKLISELQMFFWVIFIKLHLKLTDPPYAYIRKEHKHVYGNGSNWLVSNVFKSADIEGSQLILCVIFTVIAACSETQHVFWSLVLSWSSNSHSCTSTFHTTAMFNTVLLGGKTERCLAYKKNHVFCMLSCLFSFARHSLSAYF